MDELHEPLHEMYDLDVAKLNRLAAKSAERAESLKAENAKLEKRLAQYGLFREVVGDPAVEFANLRRELHRVERENEKLRELVREMWDGYNDPRCDKCHLKDTPTCVDCPICAMEASVLDRLRELGIEVEDDRR